MTSRRINLLPSELAARRKGRQLSVSLVAGGIALVTVLGVLYGIQQIRLNSERSTLAEQQDRNADLRAQIAELQEFEALQERLDEKEGLIAAVSVNEVRWSVILADISLVIPSDVWLTSLSGTVAQLGEEPDEDASFGDIQMAGTTFSHPDVATWLTRLDRVDAFRFPFLTLSARGEIASIPVVNFQSTVQLSEQAFRRNQPGGQRQP